ncbi:MAG TPA: hypothetical protein VFX03_10055, partial [Thermomicrobiales bacterium]|nr:hypothetical protein [Thermomicrobiales bacterium]
GDAGAGGAKGLVPAPAAGDAAANKALFADGNWKPLGGLSVGATAIAAGTSARILYDNSGTLGEYSAAQAKSFLAIAQTDVAGLTASSDATFKSLTLAGGTITTNAPVVNATRTWNGGAVAFTADLINITDTASAAGSLLWDRQVGGVSKAKVDKSGNATFAGAINCGPITTGNGAAGNINAGGNTTMTLGSSFILSDNTGRFSAWNNAQVGWSANNPTNGSNDTYLTRAAAGVVAFNGTIQMASVPTADPHVAGRVWSNGGVLTVSAG